MMRPRMASILLAALLAASVVLLPGFITNDILPSASSQDGAIPSQLDILGVRLYKYDENGTGDQHLEELTLSSVTSGTPLVINGLTRNQNHTEEHFDYVTEVFDSNGIVIYLDVRYGVAVPPATQVGIDAEAPIVFSESGMYIIKIFALSNLDGDPLLLSSAAATSVDVLDQEQDLPNIVVIMADDLDQKELDLLLQKDLMPNLKQQIIDKGVTFSESFVTFSLCCPSRATFLTGQYPHNHNVWSNSLPLGGVMKLDDSSTLATWLQDSGYYTANVGKYLNGYGNETPETYVPPGWNDWQTTVGSSTYWMYSYTFNDNGVLVKYGSDASEYQTDVVAKRSVEVINERESADSTPFFLYINPLAPHEDGKTTACELNYGLRDIKSTRPAPRHIGTTADIDFLESMPPSFNEEDVSDKPNKYQPGPLNEDHIACLEELFHARLESMLAVDDLIGNVMTALSDNKELNTILVFTSDNGFLLGEHRLHGKQFAYEESIRLPLYMRIPGVAPRTIDSQVINNDLAPTFLEFARAKAGIKIDGRSLVPLIEDPTISWRNGFLIETDAYSAIRTEDYVYVSHNSGGREIYDLDNDPYQLQNVGYTSGWNSRITALEDWRTALADCEGTSCQSIEDRAAP